MQTDIFKTLVTKRRRSSLAYRAVHECLCRLRTGRDGSNIEKITDEYICKINPAQGFVKHQSSQTLDLLWECYIGASVYEHYFHRVESPWGLSLGVTNRLTERNFIGMHPQQLALSLTEIDDRSFICLELNSPDDLETSVLKTGDVKLCDYRLRSDGLRKCVFRYCSASPDMDSRLTMCATVSGYARSDFPFKL